LAAATYDGLCAPCTALVDAGNCCRCAAGIVQPAEQVRWGTLKVIPPFSPSTQLLIADEALSCAHSAVADVALGALNSICEVLS